MCFKYYVNKSGGYYIKQAIQITIKIISPQRTCQTKKCYHAELKMVFLKVAKLYL